MPISCWDGSSEASPRSENEQRTSWCSWLKQVENVKDVTRHFIPISMISITETRGIKLLALTAASSEEA